MRAMRFQPQGAVRLNAAHPLLVGLAEVWLPGVSSRGIISGTDSSAVADGSKKGTPRGVGFNCTSTGRRYSTTILNGQSFAWLVVAHRRSDATNCSIVRKDGTATPMQEWDGQVRAAFFNGGGGFAGLHNYGPVADFADRVSTFCGTVSESERVIFSNGGPSIAASAAPAVAGPTTHPFCIGATEGSSEVASNWTVLAVFLWQGVQIPSSGQLRALELNPWQLFAARDDEDDLAAAASYTLGVTGASLSISGGPVGMTAARRMRVQPASASIGAGLVGIRIARRLAVQTGALALVVGSVRMPAARRLPVSPAALVATGRNVGMTAARRLNVQSSALSLIGGGAGMSIARRLGVQATSLLIGAGNVVMRAARRLPVSPMTFAITANAVGMQYSPVISPGSYVLPVSAASMMLGGGNIGMRVVRSLAVSPAALSLGGGSIRALRGRLLVVSAASLSMTVGQVGMRATRRLPIDGTALLLSLNDVALHYSAQINYARAPAGSGYTPQQHYNESRPAATSSPRPAAIQRNFR